MSAKRKPKIKACNPKKETVINTTKINKPNFEICLIYHWYKTVSIDKFTNQIKDGDALLDELGYIMGTLFPTIYREYSHIFNAGNKSFIHCHKVSLDTKRVGLYEKIIRSIDSNISFNSIKDSLWQVGLTGSIRIVGIYENNIFYPLFIDRHHLLYESEKHNQKDVQHYSCCIN